MGAQGGQLQDKKKKPAGLSARAALSGEFSKLSSRVYLHYTKIDPRGVKSFP